MKQMLLYIKWWSIKLFCVFKFYYFVYYIYYNYTACNPAILPWKAKKQYLLTYKWADTAFLLCRAEYNFWVRLPYLTTLTLQQILFWKSRHVTYIYFHRSITNIFKSKMVAKIADIWYRLTWKKTPTHTWPGTYINPLTAGAAYIRVFIFISTLSTIF